ncbi:MAG: hypothetical protein ABJP66_25675 [Hyphomicrobiales bacterium]
MSVLSCCRQFVQMLEDIVDLPGSGAFAEDSWKRAQLTRLVRGGNDRRIKELRSARENVKSY